MSNIINIIATLLNSCSTYELFDRNALAKILNFSAFGEIFPFNTSTFVSKWKLIPPPI